MDQRRAPSSNLRLTAEQLWECRTDATPLSRDTGCRGSRRATLSQRLGVISPHQMVKATQRTYPLWEHMRLGSTLMTKSSPAPPDEDLAQELRHQGSTLPVPNRTHRIPLVE